MDLTEDLDEVKLDLQIAQHERVAILGPNASGKTTLLKAINHELYPVVANDSWLRILGRDKWNVWGLRKRIGIVSHDLHSRYTPTTTAIEVVVSGYYSSIGVHGILADRVNRAQVSRAEDILHDLGIGELRNKELQHMSTGQQRRCLLARALVHDPDILILDEPTAGLDLAASFDYLRRIRNMAAANRNVLIVTHHINEVPPEVRRVIVLQKGRILADGPKASVLTDEILSTAYQTPVRVSEIDGYYLAYPGDGGENGT